MPAARLRRGLAPNDPTHGRLFVGLMSGTSLDGADAVLARVDRDRATVLASAWQPFPRDLRATLERLQRDGPSELHAAALAANALVDVYAALVERLRREAPGPIEAVGAHGQTLRHRPELGYTIQLNAPARLAEACGVTVVADFRSRDVAAGGQGAPLAPAFHQSAFGRAGEHRMVLNLGGMSNLTDLPGDDATPVRGWDCGPGNVLLDAWTARHRGQAFDRDGAWAASGTVVDALLRHLLDEPWFALPPPKSTGRDLFDTGWLDTRLERFGALEPADVQATLAELTATAISDSAALHADTPSKLIVCGGGARNTHLVGRLAARFPARTSVVSCDSADAGGIAPEHVEALAFAWLAHRCIDGLPGNLPAVTGAAGPRVLGAIYRA